MASSSTPSTSNAAPSNTIILQDNTLINSTINMHQHVNQSMLRELPQSYGLLSLPKIVDKREADIRKLHALMSDHHKVVITGIGGLGKTTLANLCARKWVQDGTYQHVLFINVETDESASGVFKRLAEIVLNSQVCSDSTVKEIYARYNRAKTLLILDNIEQNSILPRYYPSGDLKNIDILGTSQFTELMGCFYQYPLQELSKEASVQLIQDIFSSAKVEVPATVVPMITDLVVQLESHPLALEHAAALIIDMFHYDIPKMSLEQSLNKYKQHFETKLNEGFPTDHPSEYRKSVYAAISLNIEKGTIGKEHVKSLLHCMTYLDPACIHIKIFYEVPTFSTNDIKESLRQLKSYSLISVDRDVISMHRLVPVVCHAMLTADDKIKYLNILFNIFFYNTDDHWLSPIRCHCSFFIEHFEVNFDIKKEELAAYYKAAFYNNDQIKERLTARLQMINCVISDTEGWSVRQCCVFAGHQAFYLHFTGETQFYIHRTITTQVVFVQVIKNSSLYLFRNVEESNLKFYANNKVELNKSVFKNLTMLSICAAFGIHDDDFNRLIDKGCDVNIKDNNGMTPILWAAKNMCYKNVFTILHRGATCDVRYKGLLTAAAAGDSKSVLRLLRTSEVSFATGEYGKTLLWWAADNGHHDIVRVLIQRGTDTSGADGTGDTLLHMVARGGYDETISQFIRSVADINIANINFYTALMLAADRGHDKIVSELIGAKVNVNIVNIKGDTALILAAVKGHDKIIAQLAQADANVNVVSYFGVTPLHWATMNGHRKVVTELVNRGAHVDTANNYGRTPLLFAAEDEHCEITMYLIEKGASVNAVDHKGNTPLLLAAKHEDSELALKLINRGARTDAPANNSGETPLHWAARHGHREMVTELVNLGAHVNAATKDGSTPLLLAAEYKHREISMYLIEKGASVNAVDRWGDTPILLTTKHGNYMLAFMMNRSLILTTGCSLTLNVPFH